MIFKRGLARLRQVDFCGESRRGRHCRGTGNSGLCEIAGPRSREATENNAAKVRQSKLAEHTTEKSSNEDLQQGSSGQGIW